MTVPLPCAMELLSQPATASPRRTQKIGLIRMAGCWWTVMTWRSWGRRNLLTEAGTVSVFGTSLMAASGLNRREEAGKPVGSRGQEGADVVDNVSRSSRLLNHPPDDERNSKPSKDGFHVHVDSHRRR